MNIDSSRVTGRRFMFSIAFYLQSSVLLTSFIASVTKHESWISVLLAGVIALPLLFLYRSFMLSFPDKNLLQIMEETYGKLLGKILGAGYVWFFLTITSLNVEDIGGFVKNSVLPETPHVVLTLLCVLIAVWAVRHGFKVVSRYSALFTMVEFVIVALTIVLVINQINFANFLPVFSLPAVKYVQGAHIVSMIPFGELVIFLMVTPCVERLSPREATKYWLLGAGMGIIVLLIVLLRDISVLGKSLHIFSMPGLVTLRLASLGEALSRMEIVFTIAIIMLLFFKITILIYVSTVSIAQLFGTVRFKHLALIVGVLVIVYGNTLYPNSVAHSTAARTIEPVAWTLFEVILPLLTFVLAKIRKRPRTALPIAAAKEE